MNIAIDITNVEINKMMDGSRFVTEFMPMLEELGATYNIVYKNTKCELKYDNVYGTSNEQFNVGGGSISMVFSNKPNNIAVFIEILDKLSKYFSNDLLDNVETVSLDNVETVSLNECE